MIRTPRGWPRPRTQGFDMAADAVPQARFSWLPAVTLSVLFTTLILVWDPHVRDLAAQTFRTELFQQNGFAIWNGSWYGGHYTLTYSVLFPPLAALLGPRTVGALAVVASAYLFDRLVRQRWGEDAHWATVWFGVGAVSPLLTGQLTFALGVAFALLSLRCLQLRRSGQAALAAVGCALASPLAAVFLGGVLVAGSVAGGIRSHRIAIAIGTAAIAVVFGLNLAFPGSGQEPFVFSSFVAVPLWCAGALLITRRLEGEREFQAVVVAYLLASVVVWLVPNALGGNAVRLGALFGGPLLAAILLSHRPRLPAALVGVVGVMLIGSLYWQMLAGIRAVAQISGDPSTKVSYYAPLRHWLRSHGGDQARIEVPPTSNHWEAAYLAPSFSLARGWLTQLELTRNDIFYEDRLTSRGYASWLRGNGVGFVALPDAPLDYSAEAERALILSDPPYLRLRWKSAHWRVYALRHPAPLVVSPGQGKASLLHLGPQSFAVHVTQPGWFVVRVHYTPFWSVAAGPACLGQGGKWTLLHVVRPSTVRVEIVFTPSRVIDGVLGEHGDCRVPMQATG